MGILAASIRHVLIEIAKNWVFALLLWGLLPLLGLTWILDWKEHPFRFAIAVCLIRPFVPGLESDHDQVEKDKREWRASQVTTERPPEGMTLQCPSPPAA
ncbi:hypothetical protein LTS10_003687 [Elasticomyces elasticus]|nr:hypothetical protein LTS10_003687 [Elasticomyces elasticus]